MADVLKIRQVNDVATKWASMEERVEKGISKVVIG